MSDDHRGTHLNAGYSQGRLDVRRHAERHFFGYAQSLALLEADVIVDMHHLAGIKVDENVIQVPVTQADDVADDGHHRDGVRVVLGGLPPATGVDAVAPDFSAKEQASK